MADQIVRPGALLPDEETGKWQKRIRKAKNDRRTYEPNWNQCLAFASGKHWTEVSKTRTGRLFTPAPREGEDRYTVDELTQYRLTILGELTMDQDRPLVLFRDDDLPSRDFAKATNNAIEYGWDAEWDGDRTLFEAKMVMIDLGTAAVRCRWDPSVGPPRQKQVVFDQGKPILDPTKAHDHVAQAELQHRPVDLRTIRQGAIRWDVGTPFNLLVPAGITREDKFPWECWVEAVHKDTLTALYGSAIAGLKPDVIEGLGADDNSIDSKTSAPASERDIEDHLFVYTVYAKPNQEFPAGRTLTFVGASLQLVEVRNDLPCEAPDGTPRSGIHYFHYVRLSNRFFSRGIIELGKEAQRAINKRRTQIAATIDRGQPYILYEPGSIPKRKGHPVELIPVKKGAAAPIPNSGVQPGAWMNEEVASLREDMQRAIGMRNVSLGENPSGVGNYSQLAALQEQDGRKLDPIVSGSKMTTAELVEDVVPLMRVHWPTDRIIALAGSEGNLSADQFNASKIPTFFQVSVSRGAVQPRSQAAKLKMVDDIATFSINSGHPLPPSWLKESYEAGEPQPLPEESRHDQLDKALLENEVLSGGQVPPVAYYDDHPAHILVVRSLQSRADATGDKELSTRCEQHALAHVAQAEANAQHAMSGAPGTPPTAGAPAQTPSNPQNNPSMTDAMASTYPKMSYPPAFPQ